MNTITFVQKWCLSVLTTYKGAFSCLNTGSAVIQSVSAWLVPDNVVQSGSKRGAARPCRTCAASKVEKKMGQGRGQWQVAMHGRCMGEVRWNKGNRNDGIFVFPGSDSSSWKALLFCHTQIAMRTAFWWKGRQPSHKRLSAAQLQTWGQHVLSNRGYQKH